MGNQHWDAPENIFNICPVDISISFEKNSFIPVLHEATAMFMCTLQVLYLTGDQKAFSVRSYKNSVGRNGSLWSSQLLFSPITNKIQVLTDNTICFHKYRLKVYIIGWDLSCSVARWNTALWAEFQQVTCWFCSQNQCIGNKIYPVLVLVWQENQ